MYYRDVQVQVGAGFACIWVRIKIPFGFLAESDHIPHPCVYSSV